MKSTTGRSLEDVRRQNNPKPWVQRTGPPVTFRSFLLVAGLLFLVAVLALASAGCTTQSAVDTRTDEFTVGASPSLKVETMGGRIEITAGSDNVVSVRAELRDIRRINYEAVQNGDDIIVTAEKTGRWWFPAGNTEAHVYVTVPANTCVNLKTSNGKIEVRGTNGGGILETSNGEIGLTEVKGDFDATTSNGAVDIDTIDGSALVKTSNGGITVREAKGSFNLKTSNGDVTFSGELMPGGSNRLVTSNGNIEVDLMGTPSLSVDASTSNGEVDHPDVPILTTTAKTDHVVGTIGAGEAELYIETSNGDVTIR